MSFKIKCWGIRGSLPASPSPQEWAQHFENLLAGFFRSGFTTQSQVANYIRGLDLQKLGGYGTATTCVEVINNAGSLIIDGGSGIRNLSEAHMKGPLGKGQGHAHIFLTHFHWDHLIGLPFFAPHFIAGNKVTYYAVQSDASERVKSLFQKPFFPVSFDTLAANIEFVQLAPRKAIDVLGMKVTPYQLDHPDPCWGFKIEHEGKAYSHCVDTEGTRVSREALGADLPLYQNVNLMYFDAQYTLPELAEKANWGHSAAQIGLDIAFRESVGKMIFSHHDPGASTEQLEELKRQTQEYYDWKIKTAEIGRQKLPPVKWCYAFEGLEVDLHSL